MLFNSCFWCTSYYKRFFRIPSGVKGWNPNPQAFLLQQLRAHPKSRIRLIAVVSIIAVSVVFGALFVSAFISAPPQGQDAWLFKGAYAKYAGSLASDDIGVDMSALSMSFDFNINFTLKLEVLDFNNTHALISTSFRMSSSVSEINGENEEDKSSVWVPLSEMGFIGRI